MARFEMHSHSDMSNIRLIDCINTVDSLVNYAVEIGCSLWDAIYEYVWKQFGPDE